MKLQPYVHRKRADTVNVLQKKIYTFSNRLFSEVDCKGKTAENWLLMEILKDKLQKEKIAQYKGVRNKMVNKEILNMLINILKVFFKKISNNFQFKNENKIKILNRNHL